MENIDLKNTEEQIINETKNVMENIYNSEELIIEW
ncbi:MAG: hypothetical protein PWQ77_1656 [Kosmotogales bacterium]|jgi:hypothetical protein|nr:hypothetical protein [Kosmotogales bacterium]